MQILLGTDNTMHDEIAGTPGDFERIARSVKEAIQAGEEPSLAVGLSRKNFFAIDSMLSLAAKWLGIEEPDTGEDYSIHPIGQVYTNLTRHLKKLTPFMYQSGIEIEFVDENLSSILRNIERVSGPTNEGDLLRILGIFADRVFTGPKRLLIDPLYACNLDCVYCNNFSEPRKNINKERMQKDPLYANRDKILDYELFEETILQAEEMGVEAVSIVGGGEPTLHPRFADMLQLACTKGFQVDFSTNGISMNENLRNSIAAAPPDSITFSIAAASEESYKTLHPSQKEGTFTQIMKNASSLASMKTGGKPNLIALHVLCNTNYNEAEEMVRQAAECGFDEVWLQLLHVRDFCQDLALSGKQIEECAKNVARARELADKLGIRFSDYITFQLEQIREDGTWSKGSFVDRGCLVGWTFSILTCGGDISFCCGWKFIGNAQEKNFRQIWESEKYRKLRTAARFLGKGKNPILDNGKHLFDEFCLSCDNHNLNMEVFELLDKYDLLNYLETEDIPKR